MMDSHTHDITDFLALANVRTLSGSAAELGQNAGAITWRNSLAAAAALPLLDTDDKREAFRDFVRSAGAWDDEEIAAWDDQALNALALQWIAGDVREADLEDGGPGAWRAYEFNSQAGRCHSNLYRDAAGRVFWSCQQ